jgi:cell wall-associated NlpC family hydrolase
MTAADLIAAARACLDTPFIHQGRLPGQALDCAGLLVAVARAVGADYRDVAGYSRSPSGGLLEYAMDNQPCLVRVPDLNARQPGDVLLMRFTGDPQHLTLYAGNTIIHGYEAVGRICEHRLTEQWARRIVRVYRFRDLT